MANVLTYHGVRKGDTVAVYMPMVPDLAFVMLVRLATTRLAIHRNRSCLLLGLQNRPFLFHDVFYLCAHVQACTRIGAIHSVVFAGFSADSLRDRIIDAQSKYVRGLQSTVPHLKQRGGQMVCAMF